MCIVCLTVASAIAITVSLVTTSCSKAPDKPVVESSQLAYLPAWVSNPYAGLNPGVIAGVGISNQAGPKGQHGSNIRYLIIQAESQARAEIATTLQTTISRMTTDAMQNATIDNKSAVETAFSTVTREVVQNVPLSGAVRDNLFQDPKDGAIYVRMIIDSSVVKNYLKSNLESYADALKDANVSRDMIQKTNASLKGRFDSLDAEIAKTQAKN